MTYTLKYLAFTAFVGVLLFVVPAFVDQTVTQLHTIERGFSDALNFSQHLPKNFR